MSLSTGNLMLFCLAKAALAAGESMLTPKTSVSEASILPASIPDWTAWSCLHVVTFEDAIGSEHLFVHVAKHGKFDVVLFGKSGIGRRRIHADAENFGIGSINFTCVDSRLDRLELFGSTTCEGKDIYREKDVFLAAKIAEFDGFPLITEESEIRRSVADLEGDFGDLFFLLIFRTGGQ